MFRRIILILGISFFSVGAILALIGIGFGLRHWNNISNTDPVTATIIDINRHATHDGYSHSVFVEYEIDGTMITSRLNWWSSGMRVGQPIEILVDRYNPYRVISSGILGWLASIILLAISLPFVGIGAGFLIYNRYTQRRHQYLLEYGTPVWARIQGTDNNWNIRINGRPATVLVATYKNLRFTSPALDNNDLMHLDNREHVKVLIHPDNANMYIFDFRDECHRIPFEPPA